MEHYHGKFYKVDETDVLDIKGSALYLRHENGMEVLHLKCDDKENLFAFAFRTPVMDGKGKPHIMEHSVLCGSKKYPLKEPFVTLMNQSVNTFLNAMTYPDMTVYPAASTNRLDYYNLMSVYGDAVFFPLLTENTFMQEAHRIEEDFSIQGVVYNEMKGAYSSSASVASDVQMASMMKGTCYEHDSGGDPLEIAHLTYKEFVDFHKEYYKASNCLLFLYGDEDTKTQLDFVQKEFLDRLEEGEGSGFCSRGTPSAMAGERRQSGAPIVEERMIKMMRAPAMQKSITVNAKGPDTDTAGFQVTLNWKLTHSGGHHTLEDIVSASFLLQLLAGNDTSPVAKALNEAGIGDNLMCGINTNTSEILLYFGMCGVKAGKEDSVKSIIEKTLQEVKQNGFSRGRIQAAVLAMDFSLREKVRTSDGPFSLILMEGTVSSWVYGNNPTQYLNRIEAFEGFKKQMSSKDGGQSESAFCLSLLDRMLLNNKECAYVSVKSDASFLQERGEKEKEMTRSLLDGIDKKALKGKLKCLHEAQERKESDAELSCVPRLSTSDLSSALDPITTELEAINGIPVITSSSDTNGIVYFSMQFPVDTLPAEDLPYLSALSDCAFYTGGGGMAWDECLQKLVLCTGGIDSSPLSNPLYYSESALAYLESVKQYNFTGRDWLSFSFKFPIEKAGEALPLFLHLLPSLDFGDEERLKTLITQSYDNMRSSVIPYGSKMAAMRSRCRLTRENALHEVWSGLSQLFTVRKILSLSMLDCAKRFTSILHKAIESGTLIHITADDKSMAKVMDMMHKKGMLDGFKTLAPRPRLDNDAVYRLTSLEGEGGQTGSPLTAYILKSQVGFAASCYNTGRVDYNRRAASAALSRWMNSNVLWEAIRTKGGAYGANITENPVTGIVTISTYRDPDPYASLEAMKECLKKAANMRFSALDTQRLITGCYSEYAEPLSPFRYGIQGLFNALYGRTNEDRNLSLKALLEITGDMLHNEAVKLHRAMADGCISSVISAHANASCEAVDLPL